MHFSQVGTVTLFFMYDPSSNSSSEIHHLFHKKYSYSRIDVVIHFIYSVWLDDRIKKLDNNEWKCLWYGTTFQGINSTKRFLLIYLEQGVYTSRVVILKLIHITYQYTKT